MIITSASQTDTTKEFDSFRYEYMHRSIHFLGSAARISLFTTFLIYIIKFFFQIDQQPYSLLCVVLTSVLLFFIAFFSHNILELDMMLTRLSYQTKRWRCYCDHCLRRRRDGSISRLEPHGLHRFLANRHTWVLVATQGSFFMMLCSTDASWPFICILVVLFLMAEIFICWLSKKVMLACQQLIYKERPMLYRVHPLFNHGEPLVSRVLQKPQSMFDWEHIKNDASIVNKANDVTEIDQFDHNVSMTMTSSVTSEGKQRLEGWIRLTFTKEQRQLTQHIPFCPAYRSLPKIALEVVDGAEVRIDQPVIMLHGVRFDVKLLEQNSKDEATSVVLYAIEG